MIEFVSLLLGLAIGPHTVEVAVGPPVASVELRLDGETVARLGAPPWRTEIDLGIELAPHELVAVGLDAAGVEVARAAQRINLPRGAVEAQLILEADDSGRPAAARLTWASLSPDEPEAIELAFDGLPLVPADPRRFELPDYEPDEVHLLTADLTFPRNESAHAEASFSGFYGERVRTDLTAVPVVFSGRNPPRVDQVRRALATAGSALTAVAVEAGGADVVVVRDWRSQEALRARIIEVERRLTRNFSRRPANLLPLDRRGRVRFVWPRVSQRRGGAGAVLDPGLFAGSGSHSTEPQGLPWLLSRIEPPPQPERVADAVAVAGVLATSARRPRAVVLIVDPATPDRSVHAAPTVRRYLARIHVPLYVWTAAESPGDLPAAWGEVEVVAAWRDLQRAVRRLRRDLDLQAIVWLDGSYLPQTIELAAGARGLEIAASRPRQRLGKEP